MFYQKFQTSQLLHPFVECYFVWENAIVIEQPLVVESPPSGYASMVFNYGEPYQVLDEKKEVFFTPKNFVSGQATNSYQLKIKGRIGMIGIVFRPAAINTLFGLSMYEFSNERINLNDVLGKEIDQIQDRIAEAKTHKERVFILDNYLTIRLLKSKNTPDRTDYAANLIIEKRGIINVSELMDDLYVCRRQFERQFLQKVGVSPKYYARIRRISYLCSVMATQRWQISDWHDLIYQSGYYDQSHFIKEFTAFTGKSPTLYLKNNVELLNYLTT
jgi:AraC-like DNA-binding protein